MTPTHPTFRSIKPVARVVTGMFLLSAICQVFNIYYDMLVLDIIPGVYDGDDAALHSLLALSEKLDSLLYASIVLTLIGAISFFVWSYRANQNARALGAGHLEFSPAGTIGWFFCPILNLWKPYQALKEIWQASNPDVALDAEPESSHDWIQQNDKVPSFFIVWWLTWIGSGMLAQISTAMIDQADIDVQISALRFDAAASLLLLAAAGFGIAMIWSITTRQETRAERRSLPAARIRP